jgi:hypothetical protein
MEVVRARDGRTGRANECRIVLSEDAVKATVERR